ncbi:hypothetical protein NPIL_689501 [Nephila pilipes]|uniref:Uncharacterized protein n=1 Tax=Nephila pilipes TaxID=299642 RepID=A0A8X6ITU0_NEPPI|nr:hypothetical protein NPIL_689501 [Nephila pilipes]
MSTRGIVGTIFVDETVTNERYCDVLANNFFRVIQSDPEFDLMSLIQDGTRPYRPSNVFALLKEHFQNHMIALGYLDHTGMGALTVHFILLISIRVTGL